MMLQYLKQLHIPQRTSNFLATMHVRYKTFEKGSVAYEINPTTMKIQKFDPKNIKVNEIPPLVTRYSTKGFTIQGNRLYGSVAILPPISFSWKIAKAEDINVESLQLFTVAEPRIELLVIGTGEKICLLPTDVRNYLKKYNIAYEVVDTPHACSTFNFLLEEHRLAGALLIPPDHIPLF